MALSRKRPYSSIPASSRPPKLSKNTKPQGGNNRRGRHHHGDGDENPQVVSHGKNSHVPGDGGHNGMVRKRLDPQTKSYFLEIAAVVNNSSGGGDGDGGSDETESICAQALKESKGQELQLACDPSCGRVLETLLLSCGVSHNVDFLMRCGSVAVEMVVDPSASHIVEAALKSVARALLDESVHAEDWYGSLEGALSTLCQALGAKAVDVMTNRYGSHVLRCLLSLLSGDSSEILSEAWPGVKPSRNLADKLGAFTNKPKYGQLVRPKGQAFPALLNLMVDKILESSKGRMAELRIDVSAGPVLQALLKALQGKQDAVGQAIAMILDCDQESYKQEGSVLENATVEEVVAAMEDRNSSHLMEVVIRSAPNSLYLELFQRFFRKRLLQFSLHPSANFIVQVLIACVRHEGQVNMIFEELEGNLTDLVFSKRSGVIAALLAACGRFHTRQKEACRALSVAINPSRASPAELVPRLLHLESASEDGTFSANLNSFSDVKMSVIGSVILQTILTFPKECSQQFCASIAAMESGNLLRTVQDASGSRVLEAFLESSASPLKHKHRIITKLEGHFAELALHPISCFTVEKSFGAADIKLKEKIASELAPVQVDLSKSRNGARVSRRCDIIGYSKKPEQWRMKESTKQSTHNAFSELFRPYEEQESVPDKPEKSVFMEKVEKDLSKESRKSVFSKAGNSSKKVRKGMKTATGISGTQNEKMRMFETMLRGV